MTNLLTSVVVLAATIGASAIPAYAGYEDNSSQTNTTTTTTVINSNNTTNNTVINNRYGNKRYNRYKNRYNQYNYGYHRPTPSNQIQFRVPVKLNIFGSDINLNIDSQYYPNYNRH